MSTILTYFYRQATLVFHPDKGAEGEHFKYLNNINEQLKITEEYTHSSILKTIENLAYKVEESDGKSDTTPSSGVDEHELSNGTSINDVD